MSRKDYRAFAKVLKDVADAPSRESAVERIASGLIAIFRADNPNFDEARFRKAAGLE
jgi:hypothetical protein